MPDDAPKPIVPPPLDYGRPEEKQPVPWYRFKYSPLELAIVLFVLAALIAIGKLYGA